MASLRVVIVADFLEPFNFNQRVLHGVAPFARMHGWTLSQFQVTTQNQLRRALENADAILHGVHRFEHDPLFLKTRLPIVGWSGSMPNTKWPRVLTDDLYIGGLVAEHFLIRGFRHFGFYSDAGGQWVETRRQGFTERLRAAGYKVHPSIPESPVPTHAEVVEWLRPLPTPLAIMSADNLGSIAIINACRTLERPIPDAVSLMAVNNDDLFCEISDPTLSAIPLQTDQIGYESARLLARLLDGETVPHVVMVPPGEMVLRRSSDALAFSDADVVKAVRYIKENFSNGVATKQVLNHVGLSRGNLDAKFRALLGRTVAAEIRRMGIEKAKQLLSTSELPMPAIARHSGFSCARQLSETFHHSTGQTPTSYRRQFRIGATNHA